MMRRLTLITAVVWTTTLAATAASDRTPRGAAQTAQKSAIRACAVLSKSEVKKIAGANDQFFDMVQPQEEPLPGGGSSCAYSGIHIQIDPFAPARLEELRKQKGPSWVPLSDVGEAAYFFDSTPGGGLHFGELYARAGQHVVTIQMSVRPATNSVDTVRPAAIALAKAIFAKLR